MFPIWFFWKTSGFYQCAGSGWYKAGLIGRTKKARCFQSGATTTGHGTFALLYYAVNQHLVVLLSSPLQENRRFYRRS
jgi:hypothetical protein